MLRFMQLPIPNSGMKAAENSQGRNAVFTEYFQQEHWQAVMPGIQFCHFGRHTDLHPKHHKLTSKLRPGLVELLFCTAGSLNLQRRSGPQERLAPQEILLLNDPRDIRWAEPGNIFEGVCLSIDRAEAKENFRQLCESYGNLPFSLKAVGSLMDRCKGLCLVHLSAWNQSVFYVLDQIPREEHGHYCAMRCFELLYLLCIHSTQGLQSSAAKALSGYEVSIAVQMKSYMEEHLDEKITIAHLSQRFNLSPTACKSCFRLCFGVPIHSWLIEKRMEKAAQLLMQSNTSILQIAQDVGYTNCSQFNVAFKKRYNLTPSDYRKMSIPVV